MICTRCQATTESGLCRSCKAWNDSVVLLPPTVLDKTLMRESVARARLQQNEQAADDYIALLQRSHQAALDAWSSLPLAAREIVIRRLHSL